MYVVLQNVRSPLPVNVSYYFLIGHADNHNHTGVGTHEQKSREESPEDKHDVFSRTALMALRLMQIRDQIYQ